MATSSTLDNILTEDQQLCVCDVILGLNFLHKELQKSHLPDLAFILLQTIQDISQLQAHPNCRENFDQNNDGISQLDVDIMLEMLAKYVAIKDRHIRKEILNCIELARHKPKTIN